MRETSVSDEDLAIISAKQQLASLNTRPGYREAMRKEPAHRITRLAAVGGTVGSVGVAYACSQYVTAAWLRWFLILLFGVLACTLALLAIGLSPRLSSRKLGAVILEKRAVGDQHHIAVLRESGERMELAVNEQLYDVLRPGDLGVISVSGSAPDLISDGFRRL